MLLQKVQLPGSIQRQIKVRSVWILTLGCVQQNQSGNWGADLPCVNLGGWIRRDPWSLSWIFLHFTLGQLWHPEEGGSITEGKFPWMISLRQCVFLSLMYCSVWNFIHVKRYWHFFEWPSIQSVLNYEPIYLLLCWQICTMRKNGDKWSTFDILSPVHSLCGSIQLVALALTTKMFAWNTQVLKMKGKLFA